MKSAWPDIHYKGPLTDKEIAQYQEAGFYSAEFREARKLWMARKISSRREGNFIRTEDGIIYSPI